MEEKKEPKKTDLKNEKTSAKEVEKENAEKVTIMPTMIDESEERIEKKRDISAIIPTNNYGESKTPEQIELISKDNDLKSDGAIALASVDENGEATLRANFKYPEPIDIVARKEELKNKKITKTAKGKKKLTKSAQKFQNSSALMALIVIIFLVVFGLYVKYAPTEKDFQPLTVKIELGDALPIRRSSFVKPGVGKDVDELLYALNTNEVELEKVGEYPFTITYQGITKEGKVIIEDTTAPELEIRNVTITEGSSYSAESFVEKCKDFSGCNYAFQDSDTELKFTTPGYYTVYIVATDAYMNSTTKKADLVIESKGNVKNYYKETPFDFNAGYSVTENYELHFITGAKDLVLQTGKYTQTFKYQDELKYEAARKEYNGEVNYTCNDNDMTIIQVKEVTVIGSNYSYLSDIDTHLISQGYSAR